MQTRIVGRRVMCSRCSSSRMRIQIRMHCPLPKVASCCGARLKLVIYIRSIRKSNWARRRRIRCRPEVSDNHNNKSSKSSTTTVAANSNKQQEKQQTNWHPPFVSSLSPPFLQLPSHPTLDYATSWKRISTHRGQRGIPQGEACWSPA